MTSARPSPEDVRQLRELAAQWGKVVARRAFGPEGPGLDVNLTALEGLAGPCGRGDRGDGRLAGEVGTAAARGTVG